MSLSRILLSLAGLAASREQRKRDRQRDRELAAKHGCCGWCGEILFRPVHDIGCPARAIDEEEPGE